MNNNDFLNNLRILLGGKENWTDEKQNYKAANDTNIYNTDMKPYLYPEGKTIMVEYPEDDQSAWATNWKQVGPSVEESWTKNPGGPAKIRFRVTDTYNGEGDSIDNEGTIKIGDTEKYTEEEVERNEKAAQDQSRYDAFFNVLRSLFGLFDGKK